MYSEELQELFKRKRISIGDSISIKAEGAEVTGELMPRTDVGDADTLVIKLSNGYNIGISKKNIKEMRLVSPAAAKGAAVGCASEEERQAADNIDPAHRRHDREQSGLQDRRRDRKVHAARDT